MELVKNGGMDNLECIAYCDKHTPVISTFYIHLFIIYFNFYIIIIIIKNLFYLTNFF